MRTLEQWLDDYNVSHQNPRNKQIHFWCVPAIAVCTVALFWQIPLGLSLAGTPVNLGHVLLIGAMSFYGYLSLKLALGMLVPVLVLVAGILWYENTIALPLWIPAAIIWVLAWVLQFVGHKAEAQKPSFFEDVLFLLIGPLWILGFLYDRLGVTYREPA